MSALEDRLAAALRTITLQLEDTVGLRHIYAPYIADARNVLAEYDRSQEACDCEHMPAEMAHPTYSDSHPHTRAHCQPVEPVL